MKDEIAIKVDGISKTFYPQSSSKTIKQSFISLGRKLSGKKASTHQQGEYTALKDINFEVKKGEFFSIVGRNGSGKSTLLKIMAGVYTPTKGNVQVDGKLTPFIELGVGFNPELSGHDNVYLNGALLGFSRKQMEEMYDDIVDFAELHDFMETKLKNYSSGMQVRLAFSVAIRAESEILLIDEVLAVGDTAFQAKCEEYFVQLKNDKRTVILVTHDMNSVNKYSDRAMLIDKGHFKLIGKPKVITDQYDEVNKKEFNQEIIQSKAENNKLNNGAKILQFSVTDEKFNAKKYFKFKEKIVIKITYLLEKDVNNLAIDVGLTLGKNGLLFYYYDSGQHKTVSGKNGEKISIECEIENIFAEGTYYVITSLFDYLSHDVYAKDRTLTKIRTTKLPTNGIVCADSKINISKE